jgi:hypothetical protein
VGLSNGVRGPHRSVVLGLTPTLFVERCSRDSRTAELTSKIHDRDRCRRRMEIPDGTNLRLSSKRPSFPANVSAEEHRVNGGIP